MGVELGLAVVVEPPARPTRSSPATTPIAATAVPAASTRRRASSAR
ncbi:MAG: hypothetical protein ACYDAC_08470 [Candidatus Dormibacteria bacterium]